MNEEQKNHPEQTSGVYETGNTKPPKSCGPFVLFLVLLIITAGVITAMGFMNIQLFRSFRIDGPDTDEPIYFSAAPTSNQPLPTAPTQPASSEDVTISIESSPQAVENIPQEGGMSLQEIYASAIDSVVSIACQNRGTTSSGTGIVLSKDGYIITNAHVVSGAVSVTVLFHSGNALPARIVGLDTVSDLAVLYVEDTNLTPAHFGDSDAVRVGDSVVAIGDPLGIELRGTMTDGIVSAINRDISSGGRTLTLIQTNAALNAGNSGGPLLNCYGQVIGINTMKMGDNMNSAGVEGLGFAIPSKTVKEIAEQLISQGYISGRPALGFTTETVSAFLQAYYRLPPGIYISQIDPRSNAALQGLETGDIILSIDGTAVQNTEVLQSLLSYYNAGDPVELIIYRAGTRYRVTVALEEATS